MHYLYPAAARRHNAYALRAQFHDDPHIPAV